MIFRHPLFLAGAWAMLVCAAPVRAADEPAPPPHALPAASALMGAGAPAAKIPTGAAAVVDGHTIPMEDLIAVCLRSGGPSVLENMINDYLVDRACTERKIVVPQSAIDARVERLRKRIAPMTLEEGLEAHHQTLPMLHAEFKKILQRELLVTDQIKPAKMANCRAIFVGFAPEGMPTTPGVRVRSQGEALAVAKKIQGEIKAGGDFGALATKHSEQGSKAQAGNIGVVFEGSSDLDTAMVRAALGQAPGAISPEPIQTVNGYYLVQVVSTSDSHPAAENALYQNADSVYKEQQAQFLVGPLLAGLRKASKVTYNLPQ